MATQTDKASTFRALHARQGAFVIPNPWDVGSAVLLQRLGFEALATTSSGFAATLGRLDGNVSLEEKLAHRRALCAATDIPVSADFENGFADDPATAARHLLLAAGTGLAGASIEDYSPAEGGRIYDFDLAVERVQAAVEAVRGLDVPFTLTARAENLIRGRDDLDDTIRRLQAFAAAGADVLYAPGLKTLDEVRMVTSAVDRPVNVLITTLTRHSVAELSAHGAKRLSIGGALARAMIGTTLRAGREMLEAGRFSWTDAIASGAEMKALLGGP